ncbi:MAG TPA: DUF4190 domain-containing protein [Ktedonobacterales bacterium]
MSDNPLQSTPLSDQPTPQYPTFDPSQPASSARFVPMYPPQGYAAPLAAPGYAAPLYVAPAQVGTSGLAIASLVCAVIGGILIPVALVVAFFAMLFGSDGFANDINGLYEATLFVFGILVAPSAVCGLAAVITGHLALSGIKRSSGALTGRGVALFGLIFGYLNLAPSILCWITFGLLVANLPPTG